jgi:general secretion pathway protein E
LELGIAPYLINATLLGVLAQRLVRTLCRQCRAPDALTPVADLTRDLGPWPLEVEYRPYQAVGSVDCRMTDFQGRTGLYELLVVTEPLRALIRPEPDTDALGQQAARDGMRPLRLAGAQRVALGQTVLDEVLASTPVLVR